MNSRSPNLIYIGGFILYLILSILYVKERIIMPDTAFQLFSIVKDGNFAIQIQRFGAVLVQAFPLIGLKLNLSLESITYLYSISFGLVYFALFLIILVIFRDKKMAFIFFAFHFFMTTHSFFWIQCELILGESILLLYFSFLTYGLEKKINLYLFYFANCVLLLTLVFIHPLVVIPFSFFIGYQFLNSNFRLQKIEINSTLILVFLYILKFKFFSNYYDSGALENVKNILTLFPQYLYGTSTRNFLLYLMRDYYFLLIFLPILIVLVYQKKWNILALFTFYFFGTILLINACYIHGADQFYLEGQYSLLTIFISTILVREFEILKQKFLSVFLIAIILLFTWRIIKNSEIYSGRIREYRTIISSVKTKAIFSSSEAVRSKLKMTWGSSFEIWLLSTIETGESSSILILDNPSQFDWTLDKGNLLLTNWEAFNYADMSPRYFIFKDSTLYKKY